MPTACVIQPDCRVSLVSERLQVRGRPLDESSHADQVLREIPIRDVDRLIVSESTQITAQAMAALLRVGIPVSYLAWNGDFLGAFLPVANSHGRARLRQYRQALEPQFALHIARRIIRAKTYNQRRVLQRLLASRLRREAETRASIQPPSPPPPPNTHPQPATPDPVRSALDWLDQIFDAIGRSQSIEEIRGYEGAATARYFTAWASFLPADFPFERRSTRPPLNEVNACISFAATLLYHETVAFSHSHGLDPALGTLHVTEDGRWSLALDLIEPFRPALVEALALDLFSHQILNKSHFETRDGGVFLNTEGRRRFFLQYERRMERQFMSEAAGHRTTLRSQLEDQAVLFKAALEQPERFEPFLIN